MRRKLFFIPLLCYLNSIHYAVAAPSLELKADSGVFAGNEINRSGFVVPWKLEAKGIFSLSDSTSAHVVLESVRGIDQDRGPYIGQFTSNKELRIKELKLHKDTQKWGSYQIIVGKIKPDKRTSRSVKSPFPFSSALNRPPLADNDLIANWQYHNIIPRHTLTVGYGISDISTKAQVDDGERKYATFIENHYRFDDNSSLWLHYFRNNFRPAYTNGEKHFWYAGGDIRHDRLQWNAAFAMGRLKETETSAHPFSILGFDAGLSVNTADFLAHSKLDFGYAYIRNKRRTMELSFTFWPFDNNKATSVLASIYNNKRYLDTNTFAPSFFAGGIRITHILYSS